MLSSAPPPSDLLAGSLGLCDHMDRDGLELSIAATIAGAAFLGIDADPQRLKFAQQHRACDFVVHSLDEALRILKNQIRKRHPISVGLLGDAATLVPELLDRGVQPDFFANTLLSDAAPALPSTLLATENLLCCTAVSPLDLRHFDALLATLLPAADVVRHRWLQGAAACFYRQVPPHRVLSLSHAEHEALLHSLEDPAHGSQLLGRVTPALINSFDS